MSTRNISFLDGLRPIRNESTGGQGTKEAQHRRKNALGSDKVAFEKKISGSKSLPPKAQKHAASKQAAGLGTRTGYFSRQNTTQVTKKRTFFQALTDARRDALETSRLNEHQVAQHLAHIENQRQQTSERVGNLLGILQRELTQRHQRNQHYNRQFVFNEQRIQQNNVANSRLFGFTQQMAQRTAELTKNAAKIQQERQQVARSLFNSAQTVQKTQQPAFKSGR